MNKLEELQAAQGEFGEEAQLQQQIQQLEMSVKQIMTKDALQRFGNIKAAHPERAIQVLAIFGQAIQTGKIDKIDDDLLKEILIKIVPKKKEFKVIEFDCKL